MPRRSDLPLFDFTPEDREEMQCLMSELDLDPDSRHRFVAELLLLRKLRAYAQQYRYHFPERMQAALRALASSPALRQISAGHRAELEECEG